MVRRIIVSDVDEVLFRFLESFLIFMNHRYGKDVQPDGLEVWDVASLYGLQRDALVNDLVVFSDHGRLLGLDTIEGSVKGIKELARYHDLYAITGRPDRDSRDTITAIRAVYPNCFTDVQFSADYHPNASRQKKAVMCRGLGARILIEDSLKVASEFAALDGYSILLDKPWNQGSEPKRVIRVYDWREIFETVRRLE